MTQSARFDTDKGRSADGPHMTDTDAEAEFDGRVTAPQQPYSMAEVQTGFVVLAVGLAVTFAIPLLLG